MNYQELLAQVSSEVNLPTRTVKKIVDALLPAIKNQVGRDQDVRVADAIFKPGPVNDTGKLRARVIFK